MKEFELPNINVICLNAEDVISTSTVTNGKLGEDIPGQKDVDWNEIF